MYKNFAKIWGVHLQDGAPRSIAFSCIIKWLNSMVYGRYNELVHGVLFWYINQHSHHWGAPYLAAIWGFSLRSVAIEDTIWIDPPNMQLDSRNVLKFPWVFHGIYRPNIIQMPYIYILVVWNIFYGSIYWECHHPNWRTHTFQRGRYTTNQVCVYIYMVFLWPLWLVAWKSSIYRSIFHHSKPSSYWGMPHLWKPLKGVRPTKHQFWGRIKIHYAIFWDEHPKIPAILGAAGWRDHW